VVSLDLSSRAKTRAVVRRLHVVVAVSAALIGGALASGQCQLSRIVASDYGFADGFGYAVDSDGSWAIVGAYGTDETGPLQGTAYIFRFDHTSGAWLEHQRLNSPDNEPYDFFGWSVGIDQGIAVVGAPGDDDLGMEAGAAWVFRKNELDVWEWDVKLLLGNGEARDLFGSAVGVSAGRVAVTSPQKNSGTLREVGAAYVFEFDPDPGPGVWFQSAEIRPEDGASYDHFGQSVDLKGKRIIVGSPYSDDHHNSYYNSGSAYVYRHYQRPSRWESEGKLVASDRTYAGNFGTDVAIDGMRCLIGALTSLEDGEDTGSAYIFSAGTGVWKQEAEFVPADAAPGDLFGISVDLEGGRALVGAMFDDSDAGADSGSAYLFEHDRTAGWFNTAKFTPSDPVDGGHFGQSVNISDGIALVGAEFNEGSQPGVTSGASYAFSASNGPLVTANGECPGDVVVWIDCAQPEVDIAVLLGTKRGSKVITGGLCAGTDIGIRPKYLPGSPVYIRSDMYGRAFLHLNVPPGLCGELLIQAIDLSTCRSGNVFEM
jgi:hypothetical protein